MTWGISLKHSCALPLAAAALFTTTTAFAQEGDGEDTEPTEEAAAAEEAPAEDDGDEGSDEDGVRFRGGVSAGGGGLFISGASLGLGGVDGRVGVQINDLIGVYAQPQIAIYGGTISSGSFSSTGVGGIIGGTAVVDFTFIDQLFAGVGGGGALVNNPSGGVLHFRAGGYPLFGYGEDGIRRKGLVIAADVRLYFAGGGTFISPMASIGYEAF